MVNENYFQFDRKSLFNKNRKSFSEFKFLIIARTFVGIRHRRTLEFFSYPSLPPNVRQLLPDSDKRMAEFWPFSLIQPKWPDLGRFGCNLARE
jgi:hypothetical protein